MEAFLGIDVSKGYADFAVFDRDLRELDEPFQLDDTPLGHESLRGWISGLVKKKGISTLSCALESTGGLENNWHAMLVSLSDELPLRVARLNPAPVKNAAKAELSPNVNDAISARNIAMYIMRYGDRVSYRVKDTRYSSFRSLTNHIVMMNKQKTQLVNELKQLLYFCFPEVLAHARDGIPNWVLLLLEKYPTSAKIARAKPERLAKIKGLTLAKAEKLVARAGNSVSSRGNGTDAFLIRSIAAEISGKVDRIAALKARLASDCRGPEVDLVESIKGIGAYTAAVIMTEIEDIGLFPTPGKLAGYFGLHPKIVESGDKRGTSRMSKQGRPHIRAALYMCARSAAISDPNMKAIYARHRARGKSHNEAIGVIMHKMLRTVWGILTSGKPYDPQVDMANQRKKPQAIEEKTLNEVMAKRRIQGFDEFAPVSVRANKKRKAFLASQPSNAEDVRDLEEMPRE